MPQDSDPARGRSAQGTILEALPHAMYSVGLDNGRKVLGHVSSDLRARVVRLVPGDRVTIELSPYDPTRGRITERQR